MATKFDPDLNYLQANVNLLALNLSSDLRDATIANPMASLKDYEKHEKDIERLTERLRHLLVQEFEHGYCPVYNKEERLFTGLKKIEL